MLLGLVALEGVAGVTCGLDVVGLNIFEVVENFDKLFCNQMLGL